MSQASKQVDWCLNKAKRELEECSKLGLKPKHRGLIKAIPDIESAIQHLSKAEHNLKVSKYLMKGGFTDTSISTLFYAISKKL